MELDHAPTPSQAPENARYDSHYFYYTQIIRKKKNVLSNLFYSKRNTSCFKMGISPKPILFFYAMFAFVTELHGNADK